MPPAVVVEPLLPSADERAVAVLARAFRDNPLDVAVIGGSPSRRLRSVTWGMRSTLLAARRGRGTRVLAARALDTAPEHPEGILVAVPSSSLPLPAPPLFQQLRASVGQGSRALRRWGIVFQSLEPLQPREMHWYLSLVGVDPPHHGQGLGRALVRSWLEAVDPDGLPSYLETDRVENLAFYAREGFEVVTDVEVLGARVWCMRRPSRC